MEPSTTAAPEPTTGPDLTYEQKVDEVFLSSVRMDNPGLENATIDMLKPIAEGFCTMYDHGASMADVNDYILKGAGIKYTLHELVSVHGAGVAAYCPEHMDKLDG